MKLTILGTGTSQGVPVLTCRCDVCCSSDPKDQRLRTSVHIQIGDTGFVIDAGPDFRTQMLGASVMRLDAVLLTHSHHDHMAGLDDVRAYNFTQKSAMPVYGDELCISHIARYYDYAFGDDKYPGTPEFQLIEVGDKPFFIQDTQIIPIPVYHGKLPILGYRVGKLAYITDASHIPSTSMELLYGLDVLIVNALRHNPHHSHFSIAEAIAVIEELKPLRAFLTHISHVAGTHEQLLNEMPLDVWPAYDGQIIEV